MRQLWILVALVACKANPAGDESSGGGGGGWGGAGPTPDWSGKKLVSQQGTVEGLAFTIEVPEGLPRDPRQGGDWETQDAKFNHAPKIFTTTIEIARIQDLKEAKYHATLDAFQKTWVREQSRPDSWALTYAEADKSRIEAITYKQATDTLFIRCKAVQASDGGPLPSYAKTRTMLETICDSLKPTGAAPAAPKPEQNAPEAPSEAPTPTEKAPPEADQAPAPPEAIKAPAAPEPAAPAAPAAESGAAGKLRKAAGDKVPE